MLKRRITGTTDPASDTVARYLGGLVGVILGLAIVELPAWVGVTFAFTCFAASAWFKGRE
jgi:uncharacterized membrane protein YccC